MPARASAAVLGVLGVVLSGCILLVSAPEYGTKCRFAGAQSTCGECVATRCQTAVDTCCGEGRCADTLGQLESCASKHDQSCTLLLGTSAASSAAGASLRECIARGCGGACQAFEGTSETTCKELPLAPANACSCVTSGAAEPNDFTCSAAAFPNARCCAPKGWPAAGLECSCKHVQCNPTPTGCSCTLVDYTPDQETCGGTPGLTCCASTKSADCSCGSRACYPEERTVPSCSSEVIGCGVQVPVDSCSRRAP